MINVSKFIVGSLCLLMSAQQVHSQTQDESVILYNRQAVKVKIVDDKIASFNGAAPAEYMKGYDLKQTKSIAILPAKPVASVGTEFQNADYSILSKDRIFLQYRSGFATLDKTVIAELNSISSILKADLTTKLLLTAHTSTASSKSSKLAENRIAAAKMYLKIKGIDLTRIQTETLEAASMEDQIAINYLK